jgi:multiple sugar transport system permease protein
LEEAAVMDGANRRQVFWNVTLPIISPVVFFQVVTGIIATLQVLVQPLLLSQTTDMARAAATAPESNRLFMVEVYREFFVNRRFGYGSAMLWVYFLFILLITVLVVRSGRFWVHYNVEGDQ